MAAHWTLTIRNGPRVERIRCESLAEAIEALRGRLQELTPDARRRSLSFAGRRYDPARQVAIRAELTGPGGPFAAARGGVDLRGDGSTEASRGRIRRALIEPRPGESVYEALQRTLAGVGERRP